MRLTPRSLGAILALASLWGPGTAALTPTANAPTGGSSIAVTAEKSDVVIDEVAAAGPRSATDGFFELRNDSAAEIDLTGWSVSRCTAEGSLEAIPDVDLRGVVLAPGALFTAEHLGSRRPGLRADAYFARAIDPTGYGFALRMPDGSIADRVAVYANTPIAVLTECGIGPNLPVTLAEALDESWQRTEAGTWVRAKATPGAPNAARSEPVADTAVRIDEIAPAGRVGHGDDLVELRNTGVTAQDVGGWKVYRCTARGIASEGTLQYTFPEGARLAGGERFVLSGPEGLGTIADARMETSLADRTSGILIVTAKGLRVDGLTISAGPDTACQTGDAKFTDRLDFRRGESWQRQADGRFLIARSSPGAINSHIDDRYSPRTFSLE
ncbi:lamin tail domain-containing protein [Microbacterium sp. P01]|uniref:lamin tail domain-containing protein n=1 Tax=Microbacterium sp. P01 TaxID=3366261 RepID=UPI00366D37EA